MTIPNHDLGGVLVGHDDSRLGQLGSRGRWIVRHQWLLGHACVLDSVDRVGFSMEKCKETVSTTVLKEYLNVEDL